MRYRPKSLKSTVLIICIAVAVVILAQSLGFASTRSAFRVMYSGNEGWSNWSGHYAYLDGTMKKVIHAGDDDVLTVAVETESGNLSITITDRDGNVVFSEAEIPTGSYEIPVSGSLTVLIQAKAHKGSFDIRIRE